MAPWMALLALLACAAARAEGVIYKCVDPAGHTEFTDVYRGPYCKVLEGTGAITTPPARKAGAPHAAAAPSPSDFPRVDSAEQRARDADRRAILTDELNNEMQKLADLRKEFNNGEPERRGDERNYAKYQERVAQLRDDISRSEKNIDALKREIANIK
jgi:hypothetical protein